MRNSIKIDVRSTLLVEPKASVEIALDEYCLARDSGMLDEVAVPQSFRAQEHTLLMEHLA